ncbi:hypothetical protein IWX90DRAFT_138182 [Phyllosticta citrichinensis]|uniref:Uncharacterized protein n=1 Tax=Phyllosticta citrichinensis TaxID=1130410 RepID=A0ABR1XYA9_9PEZI
MADMKRGQVICARRLMCSRHCRLFFAALAFQASTTRPSRGPCSFHFLVTWFLRISLWLGIFSDVFSQNLRHSVSGGYGRMGTLGALGCVWGAGGRWVGHARDGWDGRTDGYLSSFFPSFPCLGCCSLSLLLLSFLLISLHQRETKIERIT